MKMIPLAYKPKYRLLCLTFKQVQSTLQILRRQNPRVQPILEQASFSKCLYGACADFPLLSLSSKESIITIYISSTLCSVL